MKLTKEELQSRLHYDPLTGDFTWIDGRNKGQLAGGIDNHGYWRIQLGSKLYKASRLIFLYMTGEMPKGVVDHRDRIRTNDTWDNLRDVTVGVNNSNKSHRPGKSGEPGVYWHKQCQAWETRPKINDKRVNDKMFEDLDEAIQYKRSREDGN